MQRNCTVPWAHSGLTVVFAGSKRCGANQAMRVATITPRGEWRTWAGLRVGDPVSQIRARHPHATAHDGVWCLPSAAVAAVIRAGRIQSFRMTVAR